MHGFVFLKPEDYDGVDRSGFNDREEQAEEELCDSSVPASSLRRKKMRTSNSPTRWTTVHVLLRLSLLVSTTARFGLLL